MDLNSNHANSDKRRDAIIPQFMRDTNCLELLQQPHLRISKTKKICTLGPKSSTVQMLLKLMDNGMNVARLNFSHGTHQSHANFVNVIRQANKVHPSKKLSVLLDTKGPQIRTGKNLDGKTLQLQKGQQLQITIDYNFLSTEKRIACSYTELIESIHVGSSILFSDGQVSSVVKRIDHQNKIVVVEVLNDGKLGEKKNMCLPGCIVNLPTINPYDQNDIVNFGLIHKVDFIAVSFARYRSDIEYLRQILAQKDPEYAKQVRIISKIENRQALQNIDEIISASDGIMVARGDLGMETPLQKLILLQKLITTKCLNQGKFLIVATQMIESMQTKPRPTRAQVSDIANTVLDMADSTMTSGETANGQFPVETISYMNKISIETEKACDYERLLAYRLRNSLQIENNQEALKVVKIVQHSFVKNAQVIFLKTENLKLVNMISAYRPSAYIFVFSKDAQKMRNLTALNYGVYLFEDGQYLRGNQLLNRVREEFGFREKVSIIMAEFQLNGLMTCHNKQIHLVTQ